MNTQYLLLLFSDTNRKQYKNCAILCRTNVKPNQNNYLKKFNIDLKIDLDQFFLSR